jgi:hypothetical protein
LLVADSKLGGLVGSRASNRGWEISLDESADAYVATFGSPEAYGPQIVVRLPRRTIEDAVFAAATFTLEVTPDGRIAAYAESNSARTLAATALSALIGDAVSHDALGASDDPAVLERLETDLARALEAVRQARRS